jgi:putative sigma-54 modulation protein
MAILVSVKGRNHLPITDGLRQAAEDHVAKLEKFSHDIREAIVNISAEKSGDHRVEVTLQGDGFTLRGEEHTSDTYVSMDRVVGKLEQRLKKLKAKRSHLRNHADTLRVNVAPNNAALSPGDGVLPAQSDDEDVDFSPQITRTKAVTMKPMSVEDAAGMLELVDHPWYVFLDMDSNQTQVIYKRRDGNYGLVVPKI